MAGHTGVALDTSPTFEWSVVIITCTALASLLTVLIVAKFVHQRRTSVDLPSQKKKEGMGVPLSAASMGLSLSLLAITAVVAFVLAYNAGRNATDTATTNSREAVRRTHQNAVENVDEMAETLLRAVRTTLDDELQDVFLAGGSFATQVQDMYVLLSWDWKSFAAHSNIFMQLGRTTEWYLVIRTTYTYFFLTEEHMTDGTTDISDTDNGLLYGINEFTYNDETKVNEYRRTRTIEEMSPFTRLGASVADPFSVMSSSEGLAYHVTKYAVPMEYGYQHPLSVATTLSNVNYYLGAVEWQLDLSTLTELMQLSRFSKKMETSTAVVFDHTGDIIATSSGVFRRQIDQIYTGGSWKPTFAILNMEQSFDIEVNGMAGYVKRTFGAFNVSLETDEVHVGSFEQSAEYTHPETTLLAVSFAGGVKDDTANNWHLRSSGGVRVVQGDRRGGGEVLSLNGTGAVHLLTDLTIDVERVRATRENTSDGSWKSSFAVYANAVELGNGTVAIRMKDEASGKWYPMQREAWHTGSHTVAMWVKPTVDTPVNYTTQPAPQLLADEHPTAPYWRLLANGELVVGEVCRTQAVGLRGGEWVHLAAVVRVNQSCAVYVNGRLHSKGEYAGGAPPPPYHGRPYRIGAGYHGEIDDFRIHNISMGDSEVARLHQTGEFRREVPQRSWRVQLSRRVYGSVKPLLVYVAVMMPYEAIRGGVDENNVATMADLGTQEANTKKTLDHTTNDTIFILVVIALASVLIFLVFNELLTRPFAAFACHMTDIAVMKVEEIEEDSSFIRELNAMHRAMALMVGNLREYKSYMPQTLLVHDTSEDNTSDTDSMSMSMYQTSDGSSRRSCSTVSPSRQSNPLSGLSSQDLVAQNVANAKGKKAVMALSLSRKKVTFAAFNFVNWHETFHGEAEAEMLAVHGACLNALLPMFQACKGVPDQFSGDRILVSFNACRPVATHRVSACRAALLGAQRVHDVTSSSRPLSMSVGVASGEARVGNMGTEGMKKFSFITPVLTWVYALERYSRSLDLPNLVDSHVAEDAKAEFLVMHVDSVLFKKRHPTRPIRVSQLMKEKDSRDVEWMYQMDEGERTDPYGAWNETCKAVFSGDWKEAAKHAALVVDGMPSDIVDRMLRCIQKKEYTHPTILFH